MPHPMNRSPCPPLLDSASTEPAKPIRDAVVSFEVQPLTDAQAARGSPKLDDPPNA